MKPFKEVPIPPQMGHLPLDRRGYPIPVNVLIDDAGQPHFTVTDEARRQETIRRDECSLCGKKLLRGRWLIGGPGSAFSEQGAYIDPPMHEACARYAIQVCPYLALPSYRNRIEGKTVDPSNIAGAVIAVDEQMMLQRPDPFVLIMTVGQRNVKDGDWVRYIVPKRPLRRVEYWSGGERLSDAEGEARSEAYMKTLAR